MEIDALTYENITRELEAYAQELTALYKQRLKDKGKIASGKLTDTIQYHITSGSNEWLVSLDLQDYWRWVEYGRRAYPNDGEQKHWPPISAIRQWVQVKPVLPRPMRNGKLPTQEQLAWMIRRAIGVRGIQPTNALTDSVQELNERYISRFADALAEDFGKAVDVRITRFLGR